VFRRLFTTFAKRPWNRSDCTNEYAFKLDCEKWPAPSSYFAAVMGISRYVTCCYRKMLQTSATSPVPTTAEGTPEKKHKKKRGFRMPSFSSKKKEK
jgi:hypothetical protein